MVRATPKGDDGVNYIWEIQDSGASMTVLDLEQYRSAVELCESLLDKNSIVRPSDASVLDFPIDFEALARWVFACNEVENGGEPVVVISLCCRWCFCMMTTILTLRPELLNLTLMGFL